MNPRNKYNAQEVQEILDFLDNDLRPIVSPENWNVYSRLHDMVARMETVEEAPEPTAKWIPSERDDDFLVCSHCKSHEIAQAWREDLAKIYRYCPKCGRKLEMTEKKELEQLMKEKGNRRASKVEGKTGHWIDHGSHMTCSQCGEVHVQDSYANYCCVCGSKNR